jgi:hypothetical protein
MKAGRGNLPKTGRRPEIRARPKWPHKPTPTGNKLNPQLYKMELYVLFAIVRTVSLMPDNCGLPTETPANGGGLLDSLTEPTYQSVITGFVVGAILNAYTASRLYTGT